MALSLVSVLGMPHSAIAQDQKDWNLRSTMSERLRLYSKQGDEVALMLGKRQIDMTRADTLYMTNWDELVGMMPTWLTTALPRFQPNESGRSAWISFANPLLEAMEKGNRNWDTALSGRSMGTRFHRNASSTQQRLAQQRNDVQMLRQKAEAYFMGGDSGLIARIDASPSAATGGRWAKRLYPSGNFPPPVTAALERARQRDAQAARMAEAQRGARGQATPGVHKTLPPMAAAGGVAGSKSPAEMRQWVTLWASRLEWEDVLLGVYLGWEDASVEAAMENDNLFGDLLFGRRGNGRIIANRVLGAQMYGLKTFCPKLVAPHDRAVRHRYPEAAFISRNELQTREDDVLVRRSILDINRLYQSHGCGPTMQRYVENAAAILRGQLMPHRSARQ